MHDRISVKPLTLLCDTQTSLDLNHSVRLQQACIAQYNNVNLESSLKGKELDNTTGSFWNPAGGSFNLWS